MNALSSSAQHASVPRSNSVAVAKSSEVSAPLVTVMLLSYKHGRWATEALESVRNQTYPFVELIAMDDGSPDDSGSVIAAWCRDHWPDAVFIVHRESSRNIAANVNEMMRRAKGKYIVVMAMDDTMHSNRIRREVEVLETSDDLGMVHSDMVIIDDNSNSTGEQWSALPWQRADVPKQGFIFGALMRCNFIAAPSAMLRSSLVREVGLWDESSPMLEDYPMWLELSRRSRVEYIDEPLGCWRRLQTSVSNSQKELIADEVNRVRLRFARRSPAAGWSRRLVAASVYRTLSHWGRRGVRVSRVDWACLLRIATHPSHCVASVCGVLGLPSRIAAFSGKVVERCERVFGFSRAGET